MKKFGLLVIGGFAVLILLANLGPFIGLVITAGIGSVSYTHLTLPTMAVV